MIECTSEYIYKKKRRKKKKLWRFVSLLLVIVLSGYLYNRLVVSDNLARVCMDYTSSKGVDCVNNAVLLSLDSASYADLISIEKNNDGDISLISANAYKVNKIGREIVRKSSVNMLSPHTGTSGA